jgi:hypothetical protein
MDTQPSSAAPQDALKSKMENLLGIMLQATNDAVEAQAALLEAQAAYGNGVIDDARMMHRAKGYREAVASAHEALDGYITQLGQLVVQHVASEQSSLLPDENITQDK